MMHSGMMTGGMITMGWPMALVGLLALLLVALGVAALIKYLSQ